MKNNWLLLPLVLLMACGGNKADTAAMKADITGKYLPALESTEEYRAAFFRSQRDIATWVTIISEKGVSEKTELKTFVETDYRKMHDKLKHHCDSLPADLKKRGDEILKSSDSLVGYYAMVMNTFNGLDAFLDPELSRAAQDMVFLSEGQVKLWHTKLDKQLSALSKDLTEKIRESVEK